MHELGLCQDVVAAVCRRAGERPVAQVTVRVGRMHHVHPEAFEQSFAMAAAGGPAGDAKVTLVLLPVAVHCASCGGAAEGPELIVVCPSCGGVDLDLTGGEELILESIEYRKDESLCASEYPAR
ncbi:MAG: hydrogenase maturation nickel metallochaperone HypA [Acidimicrobiales bacterium]